MGNEPKEYFSEQDVSVVVEVLAQSNIFSRFKGWVVRIEASECNVPPPGAMVIIP